MTRLFLTGHAGTGKTSRLTARLIELVESGVRPDRILCVMPHRDGVDALRRALSRATGPTRGEPVLTTFAMLAQQHVGLFFPLISAQAGFKDPSREPLFINVEAAQYFLNEHIDPHLAKFQSLRLFRPRIVSQLLDNLNKSATSGFPLEEIAPRLRSAWQGESQREISFQAAQDIALAYRQFCLDHSLLDFSLTTTLFAQHLMRSQTYQDYLHARCRHVLADNVEEGPPPLHDLLEQLLRGCDSALLVSDDPGGYRLFLGAEPESATRLQDLCERVEVTQDARASRATPARFGLRLAAQLTDTAPDQLMTDADPGPDPVVVLPATKYWAAMVQAVADQTQALVSDGVPARDIAIIAPYVEDVLRFELSERLRPAGIVLRPLRPSRPLFDHPAVRSALALAKCAYPEWRMTPSAGELARSLSIAIAGLDLVRAQLLADHIMRLGLRRGLPEIDDVSLWTRVGARFRGPYGELVRWLNAWTEHEGPLDLFWQRLFTEVLSRPTFGLDEDMNAATALARLIDSARGFREVFAARGLTPRRIAWEQLEAFQSRESAQARANADVGFAYASLLPEGMLAAQQRVAESSAQEDGVLLAPVYAFLTNGLRARVQIWLDTQSHGWQERIYQPLTHPYVLARGWGGERAWTDQDESQHARAMLSRIVRGLAFRCDERIILASSQLTIAGQEEGGWLVRALQRTTRARARS